MRPSLTKTGIKSKRNGQRPKWMNMTGRPNAPAKCKKDRIVLWTSGKSSKKGWTQFLTPMRTRQGSRNSHEILHSRPAAGDGDRGPCAGVVGGPSMVEGRKAKTDKPSAQQSEFSVRACPRS